MDQMIFLIFKKSLCFQFIFILLTTLEDKALSFYWNSSVCSPQNCGNGMNMEFPFWIPALQDSHCGLPGFSVTCNNDKNPVLKISDDDYIIKDMFFWNSSISLAKAEVLDVEEGNNNRCPVPRHNFSTKGTPFRYGPETSDLFFFYDCTTPFREETFPVDCASNDSHYAFAVAHTQFLEHWNYSEKICQGPVNAPIADEDLNQLLDMNYMEVLKKGFVLTWDGVNCSSCRESGGECSSYYNEFTCFCNGHTHSLTCDHGNFSKESVQDFGTHRTKFSSFL